MTQINVAFDDIGRGLRYEVKDVVIAKINFKTIVAGLRNTHPQIIKAHLSINEEGKYELSVVVSYEFLPEVRENYVFESRSIAKEESEEATVRNLKNHIRSMRETLASLSNLQTLSGKLDDKADTEIFVPLTNKKTVFSLTLNLTSVTSNIIKVQMYYYNSANKKLKNSNTIPDEGIYVHGSSNIVELKFYAEFEDFDMVNFKIQGKQAGSYLLTAEKVETLM